MHVAVVGDLSRDVSVAVFSSSCPSCYLCPVLSDVDVEQRWPTVVH